MAGKRQAVVELLIGNRSLRNKEVGVPDHGLSSGTIPFRPLVGQSFERSQGVIVGAQEPQARQAGAAHGPPTQIRKRPEERQDALGSKLQGLLRIANTIIGPALEGPVECLLNENAGAVGMVTKERCLVSSSIA
jgi:hypothetical protein